MNKFIKDFIALYTYNSEAFSAFMGVIVVGLVLCLFFSVSKFFKNTSFYLLFELFIEKIYEFFEDILGKKENKYLKIYVIGVFFIILISNLFGVFLEFLSPIFGHTEEGESILELYIKTPTTDINFNIAMSIVGILVILFEQAKAHGVGHFIHDYFPVFGKKYLSYKRGTFPIFIDIPLIVIVIFFDILISMFLGLLEIVGIGAKIVSLSFRLFGNMTSGGILLVMLYSALSFLTIKVISIDFPVIFPLILYLQELLVSFIQALVFPLLLSVFIKVAKLGS